MATKDTIQKMTNEITVIKITEKDMVGDWNWIPISHKSAEGIFKVGLRDKAYFSWTGSPLVQITLPALNMTNKLFTVFPYTEKVIKGGTYVTFIEVTVQSSETTDEMPLKRSTEGELGVRSKPKSRHLSFLNRSVEDLRSLDDFMERATYDYEIKQRYKDIRYLELKLQAIDEATTSEEHKKAEQDLETLKQEIEDRHFNTKNES